MSPVEPIAKAAESKHQSVVRSAGVVSAAIFLSRITGLIREIAMARLFGAGAGGMELHIFPAWQARSA